MQSPTAMEAAEEVLQVLELGEFAEEIKEVIITTVEEDSNNSPPVASSGPGTKTSQVRLSGPTRSLSLSDESSTWTSEVCYV